MQSSPVMRWLSSFAARSYLKRPDQAGIIAVKYPRLSDLPAAVLNELCFRLRSTRAFRLTALNIELTNRCNLSCSICPRHGGAARPDCDMDLETFKRIVDATPSLRVLLPYQWGEPLLSADLVPAVEYAARRGIRVMVTTNGTLLDREASRALVRSGLERLTVSFDGGAATHAAIRGVDPDAILENIRVFREERDAAESACALDVSMVVGETTEPAMDEFRALFSGLADRIQFVPRFVSRPRSRACRELWRGVLVVLSNGDVTVCCADHAGLGVLGSVRDRMPAEWFNSPEMRALRRRHIKGGLPAPCATCGEYESPSVSARF